MPGRSVQGEGGPWGPLPLSGRSTCGCAGSQREPCRSWLRPVLAHGMAAGFQVMDMEPDELAPSVPREVRVLLAPLALSSCAIEVQPLSPTLLPVPASPLSPVLHTCPSGCSPLSTEAIFLATTRPCQPWAQSFCPLDHNPASPGPSGPEKGLRLLPCLQQGWRGRGWRRRSGCGGADGQS